MIGDENEEGGEAFVLDQVAQFKSGLVRDKILPGLSGMFDYWLNEVVIPNDWVKRHLGKSSEDGQENVDGTTATGFNEN